MATRVVYSNSARLLVVQHEHVTLTHNFDGLGKLSSCLGALLLDDDAEFWVPTYIVGTRLYEPLAKFNNEVQDKVPGWRMRITNRRRQAYLDGGRVKVSGRFFVDYICIDQRVGAHKTRRRIPRKRIDIMNLDLLYNKPPELCEDQLTAAIALLEMCKHRGVSYKVTKGAIGSSMLKRSPYWVRGRKAAPKFINDKARKYLPGNFYSISRRVKSEHFQNKHLWTIPHCYYIDQTSAHHNIVTQITIPSPESIHMRGNVHVENPPEWRKLDQIAGHYGLVLCKLQTGHLPPDSRYLYPSWARKYGAHFVWLWTPELRLLDERTKLDYIAGGITGTIPDKVLPEYARWALDELKLDKTGAQYKKAALLAAYGMLAFNGADQKPLYRYWGGETAKQKVEIPLAGFVGESKITFRGSELSTVNVIARGLIEAETRTRSIEYARELHRNGYHVPQIYADGLLVATDQLPFIRDGWRVSHSLTRVHIPRPNAFISDTLVKLPGADGSEADREWLRTRERAYVIADRIAAA
jgi:hypothetical protein